MTAQAKFRFRGGRHCLDFAATLAGRYRGGNEQLARPDDLARWFTLAMRLADDTKPRAGNTEPQAGNTAPQAGNTEPQAKDGERQLRQARELREAIYRLVHPDSRGRPSQADIAVVNRWAARPDFAPVLGPDARAVSKSASHVIEAGLAAIARDAIDLLSGPVLDRVRECGRADCSVLFIDLSRPGQRRWCDMRSCGNMMKARRYRRAHGAGPSHAPSEFPPGFQADSPAGAPA